MRRGSNAVILLLPGVVLLASPLAGQGLRALSGALCLAGLLFLLLRRTWGRGVSLGLPAGTLPFFLLASFVLFQLLPLPPFLLELLAPLTAEWYGSSVWLTDPGAAMPLSIRPKSTLIAFFNLAAGGALYFVAAWMLAERERLKSAAYALCALGALASAALLAGLFVPAGEKAGELLPPWIVPALLPLALGLYLAERPETSFGTRTERLLDFCRRPSAYPHRLAAIAAVLSGAALIGQSGLPCLAGGAGLALFALLLLARPGRRKAAFTVLPAALFLILTASIKVDLAAAALAFREMPPPFPYFSGAGLGAGDLVPGAKGGGWGVTLWATEAGGAGSLLAALFLCAFAVGALSAWRQRRRRFPVLLGAAALGSAAVPLFLTLTRTAPSDGSGLLLFFLLAGVAAAAAGPAAERAQPSPAPRPLLLGAAAIVGAALAGHLLFHGGMIAAAGTDPALPPLVRWANAAHFDPLEDGYRFAQGEAALAAGKKEAAAEHFTAAVRLSPLTGESLQRLALVRQALGDREEAGRLLEASLALGSGVGEGYRLYADWLLRAKRLPEATAVIRRALERDPAETSRFLEILEGRGWTPEEMAPLLPRRFGALAAYGDYLLKHGRVEAGIENYRAAVATLAKEPPQPEGVARIAAWFARNGHLDDAVAAVQGGLRRTPGNPALRRLAVDFYERAGLTVRADEERTALEMLRGLPAGADK